jgi:putative ABC transport system substrate-binding protein
MNRRRFISTVAGSLVVASLDVVAQQKAKMFRIAVIDPFHASDPTNMLIRRTLGDLGYVEGKNIAIEWRNVEPALASEPTQPKLDAIMAIGASAIQAARQATSMTPIIASSDDLAGEGHVVNLAHPEGNVTGVSILA